MTGMTSQDVDRILFGFGDPGTAERRTRTLSQRFTQETPILPEVWYAMAADPDARVELLITPMDTIPANRLLRDIAISPKERLDPGARPIALRNFVMVALTFDEMVDIVLPRTIWARKMVARWRAGLKPFAPRATPVTTGADPNESPFEIERIVSLLGEIAARRKTTPKTTLFDAITAALAGGADAVEEIVRHLPEKPTIWRVALNRSLDLADEQARTTVKADAAKRVFDVSCAGVTWAVIDSGIDTTHPAFNDDAGVSRVVASYDFTVLRDLIDANYVDRERDNPQLAKSCQAAGISLATGARLLKEVHVATEQTDSTNWSAIEQLIKLKNPPVPVDHHGTHVAGIIGANWRDPATNDPIVLGLCPDIKLMDLRILADTIDQTEGAIIAALQFVQYMNHRNDRIAVHGVNLSVSLRHAVKNYACGRTPVCDECERLVGGGTVVVAAAGNYGYAGSVEAQSATDGYTSARITDPGNADSVITVGSTHRREPHTYGISYFSSRGPTGDGRMKPDLVAPGEGIRSTLPGGEYGSLDGTSQATPHVSGGAALLMGRFPELIGQPREIKRLLCDSATDLGRERMYQGHGLLDILRALQSF